MLKNSQNGFTLSFKNFYCLLKVNSDQCYKRKASKSQKGFKVSLKNNTACISVISDLMVHFARLPHDPVDGELRGGEAPRVPVRKLQAGDEHHEEVPLQHDYLRVSQQQALAESK